MAPYYSFLPYSHTFGKIGFHLHSRHTTCFPKKSLRAFPCLQMATASLSPQKRVHFRAQEKQKISWDGRLIACRGGHSGQKFLIVAVQAGREWPIRYWHFFCIHIYNDGNSFVHISTKTNVWPWNLRRVATAFGAQTSATTTYATAKKAKGANTARIWHFVWKLPQRSPTSPTKHTGMI